MCKFCDYNSDDCCIFIDTLDYQYYLEHQTGQWDFYDDDWIYDKIYIDYCPWCGEKLSRIGEWVPVENVFTPGGDPCYKCSNCGEGRHIYGVESPQKIVYCRDCGSRNYYKGE